MPVTVRPPAEMLSLRGAALRLGISRHGLLCAAALGRLEAVADRRGKPRFRRADVERLEAELGRAVA